MEVINKSHLRSGSQTARTKLVLTASRLNILEGYKGHLRSRSQVRRTARLVLTAIKFILAVGTISGDVAVLVLNDTLSVTPDSCAAAGRSRVCKKGTNKKGQKTGAAVMREKAMRMEREKKAKMMKLTNE